jgi:hypothetical protein
MLSGTGSWSRRVRTLVGGQIAISSLLIATAFSAPAQTVPGTQEKPQTGAPAASSPAAAEAAAAQAANTKACNEPSKPLPPDKIAGTWTSPKDGADLTLTQTNPKSTARFNAKGEFSWDGTFGGGTLTLNRAPTALEMSSSAPLWARQKVQGQIVWTMQLEPKIKCGTPVLEGKWYPGAFAYEAEFDSNNQLVNETTKVTDPKGTPIDVLYEMHIPSKVFYYVRTAAGLQNVEELYLGVSMILEFQFDKPNPKPKFTADPAAGDQNLTLTAWRSDDAGFIFRTDPFVPGTATLNKNETFDPASPPKPTATGGRQ